MQGSGGRGMDGRAAPGQAGHRPTPPPACPHTPNFQPERREADPVAAAKLDAYIARLQDFIRANGLQVPPR